MVPKTYEIEFYEDPVSGREPVVDWLRSLNPWQRRAAGVALDEVLQRYGMDVCETEWGKNLGEGLFEFRIRHDADEIIARFTERQPDEDPDQGRLLLRVFCHAYGKKVVLLLAGYDKAADSSDKRQNREIEIARRRLDEFRRRARAY